MIFPFFRIRALGSAALNMCFIAAGRADAYYEFGIHCWDIAAGIVILTEAGGTCLGASGQLRDVSFRHLKKVTDSYAVAPGSLHVN